MKYQLVIFDLDGTILNTLEDLKNAANYALGQNNFPERTTDEIRRFVGNGIRKLIERAVPPGTDEETIIKVHEKFTEFYKAHCSDNTRPYEGIEDMLKALRKASCLTAVVSNKADYAVQELCREYFPGLFDCVAGERQGIRKKPAPDTVNAILSKLDISPDKAVYVGDSDVDVMTAANAHMDIIAIDWGFRDRQCLTDSGAKIIVSTPKEALKIILKA
ncbi:MAG: HAD family hydrolase [Oscillospiraceae bacterium]|nr:HAD family hydrolase [Oscillospiraceae bacterium]